MDRYAKTKRVFYFVEVGMSGRSSKGKGFATGREKGVTKGNVNPWEGNPNAWGTGSLGPAEFSESVYHFPNASKSDFTRENPLNSGGLSAFEIKMHYMTT